MASKSIKKKPAPVGRPEYQPSEKHHEIVRALCLFGAPHVWIANYIGITDKTLRKHYPELLQNCHADKNGAAEASLFTQVMRGNMDAIKWWLEHHHPTYKSKGNSANPSDDKTEFLKAIADVLNASK